MIEVGQRLGRWEVLERAANRFSGQPYWLCRCECGTEKEVNGQQLKEGGSKSCGCLRRERPNRRTHGMGKTREYRIWTGIVYRTTNPACKEFKYYGGRGINICAKWRESFEAFFADMGSCPEGMSIDRIDNNGNYEPSNC